MKPWVFRLAFILTSASVGYIVIRLLAPFFLNWYGPKYIHSDEDIGEIFMVLLVVLIAVTIIGGLLGNWLFKRFAAKRWL